MMTNDQIFTFICSLNEQSLLHVREANDKADTVWIAHMAAANTLIAIATALQKVLNDVPASA